MTLDPDPLTVEYDDPPRRHRGCSVLPFLMLAIAWRLIR